MTLFSDDFESGTSDWNLDAGWTTVSEGGNTVLEGSGHAWDVLKGGGEWTDYTFETKVKRISGVVQLLVRLNDEHGRYIVGVTPGGMCLQREAPWGDISSHLDDDYSTPFVLDNWYTIRIDVSVNQIEIYVNGSPRLSFTDPLLLNQWALWQGNIGLRTRSVTDLEISHDRGVLYATTWGEGVYRLVEIPSRMVYLPAILR